MKKLLLSLSLLVSGAYAANAAQKRPEYVDQNTYMIELYKTLVESCRSYQNPSAILIGVPLDLIMASGDLPNAIQEKISELAQAISQNEMLDFDSDDAMNLIAQIIPHMKVIDPQIATSIKELQKLGVRMLAISPFPPVHADAMLSQMKRSGIDFVSTALYKKDIPVEDQDGNCIATIRNGVIFLHDYFQGMEVLETLIRNAPMEIEMLLFAAPMQETNDIDLN